MKSLKRIQLLQTTPIKDVKKCYKLLKLIIKNQDNINSITGLSTRFGLCTNAFLSILPSDYTQALFRSWEHYSGSAEYPVKSPENLFSDGQYYRLQDDKYTGTYGETRIKLAKHLIKKMKKDIKNLAESD